MVFRQLTAGPTVGMHFPGGSVPQNDIVVTECDNATKEINPEWPASSIKARWSIHDLAAIEGLPFEQEQAFESARLVNRCCDH